MNQEPDSYEHWLKNHDYERLAMHLRLLVKHWHEADLEPAQFLAAAALAWTSEYEEISKMAKVVTPNEQPTSEASVSRQTRK